MITYTKTEYNFTETKSHHKKNGGYKVTKECTDILTFDIETTSAWIDENGDVIGYRTGESADYWNDLTPISLCYIWQFSVNDTVYYGRELREFEQVLADIPSDVHTIIYVHNLAWEFAFLSDFLEWETVFARSPHKPMKAVPKAYPNVEFRCSYMLTRLSLETWGDELGVPKKVGDLDYDIVRTPLTELTETELGYCERDCIVVYEGIKKYVEEYGTLSNIPLTQTGTVRRVVKDLLMHDNYLWRIKKLVPYDYDEYKRLQNIFSGGYTHANRFYAGEIVEGLIEHYDFASSYPTVMCAEKYPMTPWIYRGHELPDETSFSTYAYILHLRFYDLECTTYNTYVQFSKTLSCLNPELDNGRVMSADVLEIQITEQDYLTIKETYQWERLEVVAVYSSYKQYLPKEFIEYILDLYGNKTSLKGVEGKEEIYAQSKQYINSLFGMSVTAVIQSDVEIHGDEWVIKPLTREEVDEKLYRLRHTYKTDKRYFLSYSWGCWVTAYARRNLWECIESIDHDVIYCDTDSIFCVGGQDFKWYNDSVTEKLRLMCEELEIDFERTQPKTRKGVPKPLGVFEQEEPCSEFVTLGAKRYCERRADGLHLTVSGINKGAVDLLGDDISKFKDGFEFDKDAPCVKKKLSTYLVEMPEVTYPDGYVSTYTHGINLRNTGYNLTMTDDYLDVIAMSKMTIDDFEEQALVRLRGLI